MRSLLLLVAVLLSLLPTPAAASERASAFERERYEAAPGHDFGEQIWAGIGFEVPVQQGRNEVKSPRDLLPDPEVPHTLSFRPPPAAIRDDALPAPQGSTPLCEHLPYDATAPPASR